MSSFDTGLQRMTFPPPENKDVLIAIISSGADINHPYLHEVLSAKEEWDFSTNSSKVTDTTGEGTHSAGIIGSFAKFSASPIFKKLKILPLKVVDGTGPSFDQQIVSALNYAQSMGSKVVVINTNWKESQVSSSLKSTLAKIQKAGIIVIASSGDTAQDARIFPCAHADVICVGSVGKDGRASDFSTTGLSVDFVAPGSDIVSSIPLSMKSKNFSVKGFDQKNSSQSAAAIIASYAASLVAYNSRLSRDEIYFRLATAAKDRVSVSSVNGFPMLDRIFVTPSKDIPLISLKEKSAVIIANNSGNISFDILNLGGHANRLSLQYSLEGTDAVLSKNTEIVSFSEREWSKTISLPVQIKNAMMDKRLKVNISINYFGVSSSWKVSASLFYDPALTSLGEVPGNGLQLKIIKGSKDNFFWTFDGNRTFTLYRINGAKIESQGWMTVPKGETPLFDRLAINDFDGDGKDELFWISEKTGLEHVISYYSLPLKIKHTGSWSANEVKLPLGQDIHFIDSSLDGKKLKVPAFINTGSVSSVDRMPADFSVIDPDRHLYWLEARKGLGSLTFTTRTMTHERFREKILSSLTVDTNSLLDVMVIDDLSQGLYMLAGVKDSEGISQSGVGVEIPSTDSAPKVKSVGFDRPLDANGILLPIRNSKGLTGGGDILFVSAPAANRISLFNLLPSVQSGQRAVLIDNFEVSSADFFVDIPFIFKDGGSIEAWVQSLYSVQLSLKGSPKMSYPILSGDRLERLKTKTSAFLINHGNGVSLLTRSADKFQVPLKYSLSPKNCVYAGQIPDSLVFACESPGKTRIMSFKPGL